MYEWIHGRPPLVLRERDLARWPGALPTAGSDGRLASVAEFGEAHMLVLREPQLTTVVPLELGGVLLVTATWCDGDDALTGHLDLLPVAGWEVLPERFRADDERYVLFDGSRSATEIEDPSRPVEALEGRGGLVSFALRPGAYEVETFGPWTPDEQTELWLTRLVRAAD